MLFETADPEKGWDGRFNGDNCPAGIYVYHILFLEKVSNGNKNILVLFWLGYFMWCDFLSFI